MGGIAFFKMFPDADKDRLIKKLQKVPALAMVQLVKSSNGLLTQASGHMLITNEWIARYNTGLKTNRLQIAVTDERMRRLICLSTYVHTLIIR